MFTRDEALGTRQWAGSTFFDPDTREITFYYTAVGRPDAASLAEDDPPREISIHNEAAGRPLTEQRLASVTASLAASEEGVRLLRFRASTASSARPMASGHDTMEDLSRERRPSTASAIPNTWSIRSPEASTCCSRRTARASRDRTTCVVGMMTRADDGEWAARPAADRLDGCQLAAGAAPCGLPRRRGPTCSSRRTTSPFATGLNAPRGLYGFHSASGRLTGRWTPLNEHGLVAANPRIDPAQVYSFLVLPDGARDELHERDLGLRARPRQRGPHVRRRARPDVPARLRRERRPPSPRRTMRAEGAAAAVLAAVLAIGGAQALSLEMDRLVLDAPEGWPAIVAPNAAPALRAARGRWRLGGCASTATPPSARASRP